MKEYTLKDDSCMLFQKILKLSAPLNGETKPIEIESGQF